MGQRVSLTDGLSSLTYNTLSGFNCVYNNNRTTCSSAAFSNIHCALTYNNSYLIVQNTGVMLRGGLDFYDATSVNASISDTGDASIKSISINGLALTVHTTSTLQKELAMDLIAAKTLTLTGGTALLVYTETNNQTALIDNTGLYAGTRLKFISTLGSSTFKFHDGIGMNYTFNNGLVGIDNITSSIVTKDTGTIITYNGNYIEVNASGIVLNGTLSGSCISGLSGGTASSDLVAPFYVKK